MEVELAKISEKGQIVIPSSLRKDMRINKSDQFLVFGEGNTIILKKIEKSFMKKSFDDIAKPLQRSAQQLGLTQNDLKKAIKNVRNA